MGGIAVENQAKTTPSTPTSSGSTSHEKPARKHSAPANISMVIAAGLAVSIGCAALWAVISAVTEYQIGWMAIGIGFAVGYTIRLTGSGLAPIFGIVGAALSLLGCILGNLFTIYYFIAQQEQQSFLSALTANLSAAHTLLASSAQPMDLLFYGLALYYGYKLSIQPRA